MHACWKLRLSHLSSGRQFSNSMLWWKHPNCLSAILDLYHLFAGMCTSNTLPGVDYKGNYIPTVPWVPKTIIPGTYLISVCLLTTHHNHQVNSFCSVIVLITHFSTNLPNIFETIEVFGCLILNFSNLWHSIFPFDFLIWIFASLAHRCSSLWNFLKIKIEF